MSAPPSVQVQTEANYYAAQQELPQGFSLTVFQKDATNWHQWQRLCIWLHITPDIQVI